MALTITKLKMWRDPKYTKRCIEVPPAGSKKLPAPDYTLPATETLRPHKDSTLTQLNLPLSFTQTFGMSYLYIEATDGAGSIALFGWIDSITQRSTSAEGITLSWTVDWWRSFSGSVTFGAGLIRRCKDATYKRPRTLLPRRRKVDSYVKLGGPRPASAPNTMWVVVVIETTLTVSAGGVIHGSTSSIENIAWPSTNNQNVGPNNKVGLSMNQSYQGAMDEMITKWMVTRNYSSGGIDYTYSFNIIAAYATPIKPDPGISWDTTYWKGSLGGPQVVEQGSYGFFSDVMKSGNTTTSFYQYVPATPLTADDSNQYVITDFDGNIACTIPWGTVIGAINVYNDIGVCGGYLKLAIQESTSTLIDVRLGCEGRMVTIPLPTIPVTSNYWSDYVLTGQRDFNHLNREYSREEEAWKSGVSETKSAIDTLGSLDILGAMIGATTGFSAIGANLMVNEAFADKYDKLDDMAAARQKNTIQVNGMSSFWQWINLDNPNTGVSAPYLIKMVMDTVSAAEYSAEIANMGYEVQIPAASTSSFVTTGGPLKIEQLVITGNTPPEAKNAIKTLLENGVRIVENNPSGVVP